MIDDNYYREREQECDLEFIVLQSLSLTYMYQDQNKDVMRCYKKSHFDHDTLNAVIMINVIIISIYANINIITTIMNIIIE